MRWWPSPHPKANSPEDFEKFKSRNLHDASRSSNAKSTDLLVFKIPYSEQARKLSIRRRVKDFVSELRTDIGADFLNQVHVVVAHPVQENLFTRTYACNFLQQRRPLRKVVERREGSMCDHHT